MKHPWPALPSGPFFARSVEGTLEQFVNLAWGNGYQDQVLTRLHPLVAVRVRQLVQKPSIERLGNTRRKRLATGQILLDFGYPHWCAKP